jgi:hypothetical protein
MKSTRKLEMLALAIANLNSALQPGSKAFDTLNPGLLHSPVGGLKDYPVTEEGVRADWAEMERLQDPTPEDTLAYARESGLLNDMTDAEIITGLKNVGEDDDGELLELVLAVGRKNGEVERAYTADRTYIFDSFQGGLRALISNLESKCQGRTRANGLQGRLGPKSKLIDLSKSFRWEQFVSAEVQAQKIAAFLCEALGDNNVSEETPLAYFLRDSK